jgi:hypothetical protein
MLQRVLMCAVVLLAALAASRAWAADGVLLDKPEAVVLKHGSNESISIPGAGYHDWSLAESTASYIVDEGPSAGQSFNVRGGKLRNVRLEPVAGGCKVVLSFRAAPAYFVINAVNNSDWRPGVAQVVAGFGFTSGPQDTKAYPVVGGYESGSQKLKHDEYGTYELPKFPEAKYSDALVSLKVMNTDFRDVLWLLSDIGNVSIMLDPYWNDPPTGTQRAPGGGASGGTPGGSGDSGDGFRNGGVFNPMAPREGTGRLSLDFKDVPFDMALDLILQSVGLVKVDIWPKE